MTYHAKVIAGGKIVIPAELRREFGIRDGDSVMIERGEHGMMLRREDADADLAQVRAAFEGYSVDQFLQERRTDWGE